MRGIIFYTGNIISGWILWEADSEMELACGHQLEFPFGINAWEREGGEAGLCRGKKLAGMQVCYLQPNSWGAPQLNWQSYPMVARNG